MSAAEGADLRPDAVTIQDWCDWWFHQCLRGEVQVGWRDAATGGLTGFRSFPVGDDGIGGFVAGVNAVPGQSCYVRAAAVREGLGGKAAGDADFVGAPGIWGDLDDEGAYARAAKVATIIRPSAWVETGTRPHWRGQCFWRFEGACEDPAAVEALNRRVVVLYGGDPSVTNPTRLMRLPGTVAWPDKAGRVAEMARLVMPPGRPSAYSMEFLRASLPQGHARAEGEDPPPRSERGARTGTVAGLLHRLREAGEWHGSVLRLTAHWVGRGWSDAEILALAEHVTLPGYAVEQTRRELATMVEGARRKWGVGSQDHAVQGDGPAAPFGGEAYDPWDALRPLRFPLDALPPVLRAFAEGRAAAVGCDPAAVAMAALSALSAATDGGTRLRMKQHDNWSVPPALWVALVGPSSARKSPAIRAAWRRLEEVQGAALRAWSLRVREWEGTPKEERGEKPPQPPRFVTHDATMEALQGILANQARGCGVLRDELAGFIGQMDKYAGGRGGAADRAFWLQAFDGGHFVADRAGRGTVAVENLLAALCGGIQPDRLASFGDLTDDGLWQRFLPVIMGPPGMGRDAPSGAAEAAYDRLIDHLLAAPPRAFTLSHNARPVREAAERRLFELERAEALGGRFASFVGKLSGVWGRLALVLQAADGDDLDGQVGREAAERASRLVFDYLIPSAARVYLAMGAHSARADAARDVAGLVLAKGLARLTASDLTRDVRSCRGLALPEVQRALSPLVAGAWLAPERPHDGNNAWAVNPAVHAAFAERARREAARRAEVRALILDGAAEGAG